MICACVPYFHLAENLPNFRLVKILVMRPLRAEGFFLRDFGWRLAVNRLIGVLVLSHVSSAGSYLPILKVASAESAGCLCGLRTRLRWSDAFVPGKALRAAGVFQP